MGLRICLWGKGYGISQVLDLFKNEDIDVLAILDSNETLWGLDVDGVPVCSPDELPNLENLYQRRSTT